jgi:hypothetical protein
MGDSDLYNRNPPDTSMSWAVTHPKLSDSKSAMTFCYVLRRTNSSDICTSCGCKDDFLFIVVAGVAVGKEALGL